MKKLICVLNCIIIDEARRKCSPEIVDLLLNHRK